MRVAVLSDPIHYLGLLFMALRDADMEVRVMHALAKIPESRVVDLLVLWLSNAQALVVGDVRALKALKRIAQRPLRAGDRPARAQAAIDQIATRKGDPTAGLSIVEEAGRLSMPGGGPDKPKRVRR